MAVIGHVVSAFRASCRSLFPGQHDGLNPHQGHWETKSMSITNTLYCMTEKEQTIVFEAPGQQILQGLQTRDDLQ